MTDARKGTSPDDKEEKDELRKKSNGHHFLGRGEGGKAIHCIITNDLLI